MFWLYEKCCCEHWGACVSFGLSHSFNLYYLMQPYLLASAGIWLVERWSHMLSLSFDGKNRNLALVKLVPG